MNDKMRFNRAYARGLIHGAYTCKKLGLTMPSWENAVKMLRDIKADRMADNEAAEMQADTMGGFDHA